MNEMTLTYIAIGILILFWVVLLVILASGKTPEASDLEKENKEIYWGQTWYDSESERDDL